MNLAKTLSAWTRMRIAIRADYAASRRSRMKYHNEALGGDSLGADLIRKIGFQMMACVRFMKFLHEAEVPLLPKIASRLMRHLYGAEIHWESRIDPGVCIVHGVGLVVSQAAEIGEGCILFQNVTIGANRDRVTGLGGAPRLGRNVHVGPGATLLGPIHVGEGSKIMAGVVLTRSVPAGSLVSAPEPQVSVRQPVAALNLVG